MILDHRPHKVPSVLVSADRSTLLRMKESLNIAQTQAVRNLTTST
jgi:hypothetical protein